MKIAFLFLVITTMCHEEYWRDFFKTADKNSYSIYIHSKEGVPEDSTYKQYEVPFKVKTSWSNTMKAQMAMLEEALKDPQNQKFLFVSESTIPFRCFDVVYETVMIPEKSIFTYSINEHQDPSNLAYGGRNLKRLPSKWRYKNWQWIVLDRKHAILMLQNKKFINQVSYYVADNEHCPSCFFAYKNILDEVIPRDLTYVNWERHNPPGYPQEIPFVFSDLKEIEQFDCIVNAIKEGFLFGRKFPKSTDISVLDPYLDYRN